MRRPAPGSSRAARLTARRAAGWAARWATSWCALLVGAVFLGLSAVPQAQARVRVFLGFGPPVWGPPAYYAPPGYYPPPPPVVFTPPEDQAGPPEAARSCDAGAYVCPLDHLLPVGASCWCRDNAGRRAYGRAH